MLVVNMIASSLVNELILCDMNRVPVGTMKSTRTRYLHGGSTEIISLISHDQFCCVAFPLRSQEQEKWDSANMGFSPCMLAMSLQSCPILLQPYGCMEFSRQEYWSRLPCPPPGDLPDPGTEPASLMSSALACRFFTASATWSLLKPNLYWLLNGRTVAEAREHWAAWDIILLYAWLDSWKIQKLWIFDTLETHWIIEWMDRWIDGQSLPRMTTVSQPGHKYCLNQWVGRQQI